MGTPENMSSKSNRFRNVGLRIPESERSELVRDIEIVIESDGTTYPLRRELVKLQAAVTTAHEVAQEAHLANLNALNLDRQRRRSL
jgi:hypothetical protein